MKHTHLETVLRKATAYIARTNDHRLSLFELASLIVMGNLEVGNPDIKPEPTPHEKYETEMRLRLVQALKSCPAIFTATQIAPLILTADEMASSTPKVIARRISELLRNTLGPSRRLNGNSVWDRPTPLHQK